MSNFYMYSGIASTAYAMYAGLSLAEDAKKYDIKHVNNVRTKVEWNLGHWSEGSQSCRKD